MVKLRVLDILEQKGRSKYWLAKELGMHYVSFKKMVENKTDSIRFDTLNRLCNILEVPIGELLINVPDSDEIDDSSVSDNEKNTVQ